MPAQSPEAFELTLEERSITGMPALQSFAFGQYNGHWILAGGRKDGLHKRRPFEAFDPADDNTVLYVVDPQNNRVFSAQSSALPAAIREQLASTNKQFFQRDTTLYLFGGYSFSATAAEFVTYPGIIALSLPAIVRDAQANRSVAPHIRLLSDPRMAVTGGHIGMIGERFYLVGGQRFEGSYNPMGPTHGPGFVQRYTNAIRSFGLVDSAGVLRIAQYAEVVDTVNLHRRDYNMLPQIFPDRSKGFTVFTGVFQYQDDLPWLNTVDITAQGHTPNPNFVQYLSHYHSACMPVYDPISGAMHSIFFGGIARYTLNTANELVDDMNVPFVRTVSRVTRLQDGSMAEYKLPFEMPTYLGASAEFIPLEVPWLDEGILLLDRIPRSKTLVGYIYGGIESQAPNVFFSNVTQSQASARIFEVYLTRQPATALDKRVAGTLGIDLEVSPNPAGASVNLSYHAPLGQPVQFSLLNNRGALVREHTLLPGDGVYALDLQGLSKGVYYIQIQNGALRKSHKLVIGR